MKKQEFDILKPENIGRPYYFDPELHCDAVEQMIRADEIQIAMQMIEQVPSWYRENPYPRLQEILKTIYKQTYDNFEYCMDDDEANQSKEIGPAQWISQYCAPRAAILEQKLKEIGERPFIVDCGASHGNLPLGLSSRGFQFDYLGLCMNYRIHQKLKEWCKEFWAEKPKPEQKTILTCCEVLEHVFDRQGVVHSIKKLGIDFDYIMLSVPYGCLDGGLPNWDTRRLGHVSTFTKFEFAQFAAKNFPGYKWDLAIAPSMVLFGSKNG